MQRDCDHRLDAQQHRQLPGKRKYKRKNPDDKTYYNHAKIAVNAANFTDQSILQRNKRTIIQWSK